MKILKQCIALSLSLLCALPTHAIQVREKDQDTEVIQSLTYNWGYLSSLILAAQVLSNLHDQCDLIVDCPHQLHPLEFLTMKIEMHAFSIQFLKLVEQQSGLGLGLDPEITEALQQARQPFRMTIQAQKSALLHSLSKADQAALLNYYAERNRISDMRAKSNLVKANMHTLQTLVETYAVDFGGVYPPDLKTLKAESSKPEANYWKEIKNPLTQKTGIGPQGAMMAYQDYLDYKGAPADLKGLVLYKAIQADQVISAYEIWGLDYAGQVIKNAYGEAFVLSFN